MAGCGQELDPGQGRLPQGRRAELAGRYLREVLASLQRLADGRAVTAAEGATPLSPGGVGAPNGCGAPPDGHVATNGVSRRGGAVPPEEGPTLTDSQARAVAALCRGRDGLPPPPPAACAPLLPQLLALAEGGDAASAWLALRLPLTEECLRPTARSGAAPVSRPAWLAQSPVQALLHAAASREEPPPLSAPLLAALSAALAAPAAGGHRHGAAAAAEAAIAEGAVAALCCLQQLDRHSGGRRGPSAAQAASQDDAAARASARLAALRAATAGGARRELAPLVAWQLARGVRPCEATRPLLDSLLRAADAAEQPGGRGEETVPAPPSSQRPLLRTALLLELPCSVPADARACLLALGVSHRRAQTALLEGLWSAGGGRASSSLDAALQRWLYAEPAAAAQLVHAAAQRPSSCERRLFTRLATNRCTPRRRRASSPSCAVSAPSL